MYCAYVINSSIAFTWVVLAFVTNTWDKWITSLPVTTGTLRAVPPIPFILFFTMNAHSWLLLVTVWPVVNYFLWCFWSNNFRYYFFWWRLFSYLLWCFNFYLWRWWFHIWWSFIFFDWDEHKHIMTGNIPYMIMITEYSLSKPTVSQKHVLTRCGSPRPITIQSSLSWLQSFSFIKLILC